VQGGGDAAIALANGHGAYVKATVLKRVAVTDTPTGAQHGCQYDTQCKGDRVCESGQCVAPRTQPPPAMPSSQP